MSNYIIHRDSDELKHYGVLGMKWGFRKGTLSVSTTRKVGGDYSDKKKRKMTVHATKILSKNIRKEERLIDKNEKKSIKQKNKGDNMKADRYHRIAKEHMNNLKIANKRLSDISTGKKKAGKDFVTNYFIKSGWDVISRTKGVFDTSIGRRIDFVD